MRNGSRWLLLFASLALTGCVKLAALSPAGPQAQELSTLIRGFAFICALVWLAVLAALLWAVVRPAPGTADPIMRPNPAENRRLLWWVGGAVGASVLILVVLNLISFAVDRDLSAAASTPALTVRVTGHQWWWEVTYEDPRPDHVLTTANEIHIPAGQPVRFKLTSSDVIHSFWVPELMGKKDLVPGYVNDLVLQADRPGEYQGQCAEYCGFQHAHMRLLVIAEPREAFNAWQQQQLREAVPPKDEARRRGLQVFLAQPCTMCHTVRGTPARGKVAPDLTHLASRRGLAANTLPNTRGALAAWISDAQSVKRGVHMPTMRIPPEDLHPLLDYLQGLQ